MNHVIKESDTEAATINLKDVSKTYGYLIHYLRGMQRGIRVPLRYFVRASNELHPKPLVDDPVAACKTLDEEIVKRAPIIAAVNPQGTEEHGPFDDSFISNRGEG